MVPDELRGVNEHRLNSASIVLLSEATGADEDLLARVRIRHRRHNWLRAPWYAASEGGGAMTIGHIIHVTPQHNPDALGQDAMRWLNWLLLMAHEIGHVRQAQRFGFTAWGRARFTVWAAGNYIISFLRHGRKAHDRASFEIEAERGRCRLRAWMNATGGCAPDHPVIGYAMRNETETMRAWIRANPAPSAAP